MLGNSLKEATAVLPDSTAWLLPGENVNQDASIRVYQIMANSMGY